MGIEGKYDLTLASPPSPVTSESETEEANSQGNLIKLTTFYTLKIKFVYLESKVFYFIYKDTELQIVELLKPFLEIIKPEIK